MTTMINAREVYKNGKCVHMYATGYQGYKKISSSDIEAKNMPSEIVHASNSLFEKSFKEKLLAITNFDNRVRAILDSPEYSVPFPIRGVYFVPQEKLSALRNLIEEKKVLRNAMIAEMLEGYEDAKISFARRFPEYYAKAQTKYPTLQGLRNKFTFGINEYEINPSSKEAFDKIITDMKQEVANTIYTVLSEMTGRLKRQSKNDKLNQRTFNNLQKFLDEIKEVYANFIDREDLLKVIANVRKEVLGITADGLRENNSQKNKFHKAITSLTKEIKALPDVELKRAIDF